MTGAGCYTYIVAESSLGWQSQVCAPPSTTGPEQYIGGPYQIQGIDGSAATTYQAEVDVAFSTYSGESDSSKGSNAWSMQANTNEFYGPNNTIYVVQFVEKQNPNDCYGLCGWANVCIVQDDTAYGAKGYHNFCNTNMSVQDLSSSYEGYILGWTYNSGGVNYLEAEYCHVNVQCWTESTSDLYGLTGNFSEASGTILGISASTADFTSPTSLTTKVLLGTDNSATHGLLGQTVEENNLTPGTVNFSCTTGQPANWCTTSTPATN